MSEQQPEAPAQSFVPPADCDAAEWGGAATVYGGRCRCIVCARCGHHVANSAQGHHWNWCTVTRSMRSPNFCCPDPAFGCELEASAPVPLTASQGDRLRQMAAGHGDAVEAVSRALVLAETLCGGAVLADEHRGVIPAAREALRVLSGEEAGAEPGAAATETMEALPVVAEDIRMQLARAMYDSIDRCARCKVCEHQIGAALAVLGPPLERAEAKLAAASRIAIKRLRQIAAIEALCRKPSHVEIHTEGGNIIGADLVKASDILAITGTEGADHA